MIFSFVQRQAGATVLKGSLDASTNPNYPVALAGDTYLITVAGKVGGGSGKTVEIGDSVVALISNAGGTEAGVGTSWVVLQGNVAFTAAGLAIATAATAAAQRTALVLVPGTNVQAYDADLTTWAGVTPGAGVATALALAVNATGGLVTATAPYDAGNATGSVTLDMDDGALQYCVLTGNAEFQVPTGTPVEAESEIEVVVQDGGGFTLDFHADIQRSSDSAATFPKTLTDNKSYIFKLRYMGGKWCLVSLVGGFTIA